ncbi:MAG: hypothetical protein ACI9SJ_000809 [Flavobacteriaceae bacterium]|jgi:hypothetical protein|uniref:hypothetical protein n=1 Tax=Candidatus Marifrigoribacter sp. Uisw_064 TaxID=3230970 RepID=UPI003ADDF422
MNSFTSYLLSILVIGFFIVSCGENSEGSMQLTENKQDSTILYGDKTFAFPTLTNKALDEITQWGVYEDFESEIKSINGKTIEDLKSSMERITSQVDSLSNNIPDTLFTQSLNSRIIIIKTRTSLLQQELNKARIDSLRLQQYINEVNVSVKNFIIQINEKFLKDDIDEQRKDDEKNELEKQKRFLDSIYQLELQDQKN